MATTKGDRWMLWHLPSYFFFILTNTCSNKTKKASYFVFLQLQDFSTWEN